MLRSTRPASTFLCDTPSSGLKQRRQAAGARHSGQAVPCTLGRRSPQLHSLLCVRKVQASNKNKQSTLQGWLQHLPLQVWLIEPRPQAWLKASWFILLQTSTFRNLCFASFRKETRSEGTMSFLYRISHFVMTFCSLPRHQLSLPQFLPQSASSTSHTRHFHCQPQTCLHFSSTHDALPRQCHQPVGPEETGWHWRDSSSPSSTPAAGNPGDSY